MASEEGRDAKRARVQPPKAAWEATNAVFTNEKAGMVGFDKDRVKQIIYEMSKDSPHFKNEQRKQQQTEAKIARLKAQAARLSPQELQGHTRRMDARVASLLAGRSLERTWIHVDLDAFYAAVEELEDPSLRQKPMGVGGLGMLCTANYVARRYGIRSAMPGFIARRLCPELVFRKPDFRKYTEASEAVRAIFRQYDPHLEAASLDEAYLDVTEHCARKGVTGEEVAAELRARVQAETGLTCSCGVAPNTLLAKICSDLNKPNGQAALPAEPGEIRAFMAGLSVRKVPGIGKVGQQELGALGVETCGDLLEARGLLSALFSEAAADAFLGAALGLGRARHAPPLREGEVGRKGMSVERTFAPLSAPADLEAKCCELAGKLAEDLEAEGLRGKTLTLKLKPPSFEVKTRAVTLPAFIASEEDIRAAALRLLRAELPIAVRLMGLRMSNFQQAQVPPGQRPLAAFFKPREPAAGTAEPAEPSEDGGSDGEQPAGEEPRADGSGAGAAAEAESSSRGEGGGKRKQWACQLCTFEENPWRQLRCLVCDERRGSSARPPEPQQPPAAEPPQDPGHAPSPAGCEDCSRHRGVLSAAADCREPAVAAQAGEGAAGGAGWACPQCGEHVPSGKAQEHEDWHLALRLSGRGPVPAAKGRAGGRQKAGGMPAITRFFGAKRPPDRGVTGP